MKKCWVCWLCLCVVHGSVAAHVLDQYLQSAQVTLASESVRVELRLIPGAQVAGRIYALLDLDGDGEILPREEHAYAQRVLQDVMLEVDGRPTPLALASAQFPARREMNEGLGTIRLVFAAEVALNRAGQHQVSFRNDHLPELGVYLANALVPASTTINITSQQRDALQRSLSINFQVSPVTTSPWPRWLGGFLLCLFLALSWVWGNRLRRLHSA